MNNEAYDIGQKLYVVGHRRLELSEDLQAALGEDETLYGPVLEEEEVRSVTVRVSQTTAHDGSISMKEERWHRLSSGALVGPSNLIKRDFLTLQEAADRMRTEFQEELADAERYKAISEAKIAFYTAQLQKLDDGMVDVERDPEL